MKVIRVNGKFKVAEEGRFIAEFDTREEADNFAKSDKPIVEARPVEPLPVEEPSDVNFGQPYESYS